MRLVGATDAEIEPAVREDIDEREIGSGSQRMVEGNGTHRHADAELLGALGDGCGVDLSRGNKPVGRKQVFGDPDLVVAELLGQLEEAQIVVKALDHPRQIRELTEAEYAELRLGHWASSAIDC